MRLLLFISLLAFTISIKGQILDPKENWLELENFFIEENIKKSAIKKIRLDISTKKDHQIFYNKGEFLAYQFNQEGLLITAQKRIALSNRFDTSVISYEYNQLGDLIKVHDHHGPFDFIYLYQDRTDSSFTSLKIRPSKEQDLADTLYKRSHRIYRNKRIQREDISNEAGKIFQFKEHEYSKTSELIRERLVYTFNKNEIKTNYIYEDGQLVGKQYRKEFGEKKNTLWKFIYEQKELSLIEIYKNGNLNKKIAFTYKERMPTAIILRNIEEEYVSIYKCSYEFYE